MAGMIGTFDHPLFGVVKFRTKHDAWVRGDSITFIDGFDSNEITRVHVPQLKNVKNAHGGAIRFHKKAHAQLLKAFEDIERMGLLHHVRTFDGTENARLRRPTSGALSKLPSNHSFGTAIDLNAGDGSNGGTTAPIAPVFEALGFTWGAAFNDPMHFEVDEFVVNPRSVAGPLRAALPKVDFHATKQTVFNRGAPPDSFLAELVGWGRAAPDEIFAPNQLADIYSNVLGVLGPWQGLRHRRAVMLEVLRVLAGFESSWDWNAGVDTTNPTSVTPDTIEAGAWQVSANSMAFGQELKGLVLAKVGSLDGDDFQRAMKKDHPLAMEYVARLLRRTVNHHGPVKRHKIDSWLRRDAVAEFEALVS
ncbi:M15 family metallopeptidase [Pararoseomonas indoligenes]|uniref:M15 family metallopeptidase n=1 Tax=Roseomonas indoligenes TaxID=2820811 RepID=A0A940S7C7_9PROT|nr:M15 family metallopeptidase [Pararoseomonas indoligenes]MBP0494924.1 M15 family metallopeptidase [Pararoseomonas indoligenes]